jgi:cytochrome b
MTPPWRVPAWDWAVRLLHWTLAVLVAVDLVRDDGDYAHRLVGYAASAVVLVRLSWAAVSRSHAGLAALRPSVSQSRAYLRLLVRGQAPRSAGHNPLGVFWGDDCVHDAHALLADMMLIAVILHLAGVATMSWLWRENLPASMITGYKRPLR